MNIQELLKQQEPIVRAIEARTIFDIEREVCERYGCKARATGDKKRYYIFTIKKRPNLINNFNFRK